MKFKKFTTILGFCTIILFGCKSTQDEMKDFVQSVNSHKTPINFSNIGQERNLIYAEVVSTNRIRMTCKTKFKDEAQESTVVDVFSIPISKALRENAQTNDFINWGIEFDFVFLNEKGEKFTNLVFDKSIIKDYLKGIVTDKSNNSEFVRIPDINFEDALIRLSLDDEKDGKVATSRIESITNLDLRNYNISNLKGIDRFASLKSLDCSTNKLKKVDFSKNLVLEYLDCSRNPIDSLIIGNNDNLKYLDVSFTSLKTMNLSLNKSLEHLFCYYDDYLSEIDVTMNTKLIDFYCGSDRFLKTLDISNNFNLVDFDCTSSQRIETICVKDMGQIKPKWKKEKEAKYKVCSSDD